MGDYEKNLIFFIIQWFFRWLMSNDKNREAKQRLIEKKKTKSEGKNDSYTDHTDTF